MIDINELRRKLGSDDLIDHIDIHANVKPILTEILDRLEAAEEEAAHIKEVEFPRKVRAVAVGWETKCARLEQERDTLRARIEAMERQEPVAWMSSRNGFIVKDNKNHDYNMPLYLAPGAHPAPSVPECPYPCGWRSLLKLAIEDGAYLARNINEDEPVTENARTVTMRMVLRLRDVLMALNNATPKAKLCL